MEQNGIEIQNLLKDKSLENLYQKYQLRGLEIIAINIDNGKNVKNFIKFSSEINFFNILIKNITRLELPAPTSLPDIYLIDKSSI